MHTEKTISTYLDEFEKITFSSRSFADRSRSIEELQKQGIRLDVNGSDGRILIDDKTIRVHHQNDHLYFCFTDLCKLAEIGQGGYRGELRELIKKGILCKGTTCPVRYIPESTVRVWMDQIRNVGAKDKIKQLFSATVRPSNSAIVLLISINYLPSPHRRMAFASWKDMVLKAI